MAKKPSTFAPCGWPQTNHPHAIPGTDIKICQAVRQAAGGRMIWFCDAGTPVSYGYEVPCASSCY